MSLTSRLYEPIIMDQLPERVKTRTLSVREENGFYVCSVEMPTNNCEDISVDVRGGTLYVTARCERRFISGVGIESVEVSRYLGFVGNMESASANLENNILTVLVPIGHED